MAKVRKDELKREIEDLTNRWKRALADYQNLEKRYEKEKSDFVQFANANLILKLLTVLGHFEEAGRHLKDQGLEMIIGEFKKVLAEEGVEEINCQGEKFNPELMEAVETVEGDQENKVAEVLRKGYLLKGKVLIPAKVKVFKKEVK
jgi:molecular chaperone GrpE